MIFLRTEILDALVRTEDDIANFFRALTDDEFEVQVDHAWSPEQHLMHLCIAVNAVARGLSINRWLLRLRFGRARAPSRTYRQIRETYQGLLAQGARATGVYVPQKAVAAGKSIADRRKQELARWARVNARLRAALSHWTERDLDRIRLPHPILGKLTTREMLFFTLYHDLHHIAATKRRLGQ